MLHERVAAIASAPRLLVATDFDGTISWLASEPGAARADTRCLDALGRLARMPATSVAVVSGRPLAWLRRTLHPLPGVLLIGSHGAEDGTAQAAVDPARCEPGVEAAARELGLIAAHWPGCLVERKPFAAALHYRRVDARHVPEIERAARVVAATFPGVVLRLGSMVAELCLSDRHKGDAVRRAALVSGATHTVFIGDDATDEDAFAALTPVDLAVKVGPGESAAPLRVPGVPEVAELLWGLAAARGRWILGQAPADPGTGA